MWWSLPSCRLKHFASLIFATVVIQGERDLPTLLATYNSASSTVPSPLPPCHQNPLHLLWSWSSPDPPFTMWRLQHPRTSSTTRLLHINGTLYAPTFADSNLKLQKCQRSRKWKWHTSGQSTLKCGLQIPAIKMARSLSALLRSSFKPNWVMTAMC